MYKLQLLQVWILAAFLFVACSSDESTEDQTNSVAVTFNVGTELDVTTEPITRSGTTSGANLEDVVKLIAYDIYKDGVRYKYGSVSFDPATETAPEGFGTFQEKLLPGTYTVLFYAFGNGGEGVTLNNENLLTNFCISSGELELYQYYEQLTVTTSTTSVDVTLKRKSALMSLQINDTPLPEVSYISVSLAAKGFYYPANSSKNSDPSSYSIVKRTYVTDGVLPVTNIYTVNPINPATLKIKVWDTDKNLLGETSVSVPLYPNRRSIVSGNLFTYMGDKPMTVTIDDNWGQDVNVALE